MHKLSIICLWAFIIFISLGFPIGVASIILQFVTGNIAQGFSDLLWTCIVGAVLMATIGVITHEKEREQNDR